MKTLNLFIKKISDGIYKVERPALGGLIMAVVVLLFVNVILRYVFNAPLAWADEIARFLFTWISFVGASAAIKNKGHVAIDNFITRLSLEKQVWINLFTNGCIVCSMVLLIVYSVILMNMFSAASLASISIPQNVLYVSLPLSAFAMIIHLAEIMVEETEKLHASKGGI